METRQEEELATLQKMRDEHRTTLSEAEKTIRRERPLVAALDQAIDALKGRNSQFGSFGAATVATFHRNLQTLKDIQNRAALKAESEATKPVRRQPQFSDISIIAAIKSVLDGAKRYMHADELVLAVYEPVPKSEFLRVKRTIVSEVLRGIKKGWFKRGAKPNTFGSVKLTDEKEMKTG